MSKPNYVDPEVENHWCCEQQKIVADYLRFQKVQHGRIGEWPAWHIAPYVSIWAIESKSRAESIGWWVICGDLPTDYISSAEVKPPQHPRKAMRVFAQNWMELVKARKDGREINRMRIGDPSSHEMLGSLLEARVRLLVEFSDDDSLWEVA